MPRAFALGILALARSGPVVRPDAAYDKARPGARKNKGLLYEHSPEDAAFAEAARFLFQLAGHKRESC